MLDTGLSGDAAQAWQTRRDSYLGAIEQLLGAFAAEATERSAADVRKLRAQIDPELPATHRVEPLSRVALHAAASAPGVSAVLTGMRTPAYVHDGLAVLGWPPLEGVQPLFAALREG
jgi:aryl-alcohol dehydrogenase-like predicted oxidoreductase